MTEELVKRFEDLLHKGITPNPVSIESLNKQVEQFNQQTQNSWEQFSKVLQTTFMDLGEKIIETNIQGGISYKTTIYLNGNRKNEFPHPSPTATDVYWLRHNQLVDETLSLQRDIITTVIGILGSTMQKVVNPISFSTSDLVTLAGLFKKP